jgi:hypothetical protein
MNVIWGDDEFKPNDFIEVKMCDGRIIKGRFKIAYGDNYIPYLDVDRSTSCFTDIKQVNLRNVETMQKITLDEVLQVDDVENVAV